MFAYLICPTHLHLRVPVVVAFDWDACRESRSWVTMLLSPCMGRNLQTSEIKARGGGVLPYMVYMGMCRCEGYGFQAV